MSYVNAPKGRIVKGDEFNVDSLSNVVTHFFHSFVIVMLVMSDALNFVVNTVLCYYCVYYEI